MSGSIDNLNTGGSIDLQSAIGRLSDAEKRELSQFAATEQQKATIQQTTHDLTEMCFKKCVTQIKQKELDRYEEPCMQNCVQRFMDSNMLTLRHLEKMRSSQS